MPRVLRDTKLGPQAREQSAPTLSALSRRSRAAVHKVGLHLEGPDAHPIDRQRGSLEACLLAIAESAPPQLRSRLAASSPAMQRRRSLDLDGLDFRTSRSIDDQIDLPPFAGDWLRPRDPPDELVAPPTRSLELRVHSLRCVKDSREWGKDEIDLGAVVTVIEALQGGALRGVLAREVDPFRVGSFKKGAAIDLRRRVLTRVPVDSGTFPKIASATFMLVERDYGDAKWLIAAIRKAKDWAEKQLKDELKDQVDNKVLREVLAYAIKLALDWILGPIVSWLKDDPFEPVTTTALAPSAGAVSENGSRTTPPAVLDAYIKPGSDPNAHYQITYDWNLAGG